jgi:flagellin
MSLRINNNVEALNAHRYLAQNDKMLSKSLEKLSSGQKINVAADGPAALVISENMRAQIGGLQQAVNNNENAVSLVQTAEGALNEVSKLLIDVRQRAIAAANVGVNDEAMVEASQEEIENALSAIDRIALNTQFGRQKLLDGSRSASGNTVGANLEFVGVSADTQDSGSEGYAVRVTQAATQATDTSATALTQEMVNAGETLRIREGSREAIYTTKEGETVEGAIKGLAARVEQAGLNVSVESVEGGKLKVTHKDYGSEASFEVQTDSNLFAEETKPIQNGQDVQGSINGESVQGEGQLMIGRRGSQTTDGLVIKFTGSQVPDGNIAGSVNVKGGLKFQVGANKGQLVGVNLRDMSTTQLARNVANDSGFQSLADVDVRTGDGAQDALDVIDKAIQEVSSTRGELGAFQKNTLETNLSSLRIATENMTAAESSIRDADMALELAAFTRNQIMTQSATAQLAQANALPQNVLRLLASQ